MITNDLPITKLTFKKTGIKTIMQIRGFSSDRYGKILDIMMSNKKIVDKLCNRMDKIRDLSKDFLNERMKEENREDWALKKIQLRRPQAWNTMCDVFAKYGEIFNQMEKMCEENTGDKEAVIKYYAFESEFIKEFSRFKKILTVMGGR